MDRVILVCGKWMFERSRWFFVVDSKRGSRMLEADSSTRFEDFNRMVYEDYGLDRRVSVVELSYMFPKKILQKLPLDTPPVYVTGGRQLQAFLGQSRAEMVRLCVEVKDRPSGQLKHILEDDFVDGNRRTKHRKGEPTCPAIDCDNSFDFVPKVAANLEDEDGNDEDDKIRFDYCDDSDGTDADDENFAVYGMVAEEMVGKEEENLPIVKIGTPTYIREGNEKAEFANLEMTSLDLAVGQCYESKEELETRLKILSVVQKFDFNVQKSTPILLTIRCWVAGCTWKVRASTIGDCPQFYVRQYVAGHTCSVTERSARARQATPEILGALYKDFVGGVGPTVLPMHVAEALNKRFQIKVLCLQFFLSGII